MNVFIRIFGYGALLWLATLTTVAYAGTCTTNAKTIRMGLLTLAVDPRIEIGEQLAVRTENSISGTTFSFSLLGLGGLSFPVAADAECAARRV